MTQLFCFLIISLLTPAITASSAWPATPMVSAGIGHSVSLKEDGTVWAWGENWLGELGNTNRVNCYSPVQVDILTDVNMISSGMIHTIALKNDGTVWAWGASSRGQLGDGGTDGIIRFSPVQVLGISSPVKTIATGLSHSLAVGVDGTLWAWGDNGAGQLGDGSRINRNRAVQVAGIADVVAVAAGYQHTIALKANGTVWTWGWNDNGQLGEGGAVANSDLPVQVVGLTDVKAIAAGKNYSIAIKQDGTVLAWGDNHAGQLGDGTMQNRYRPVLVKNLTDIKMIAASDIHAIALDTHGAVWAWGETPYAETNKELTKIHLNPFLIKGLSNITKIAIDRTEYGGKEGEYSLAVKIDGTVWAWGDNRYGQLGSGNTEDIRQPHQVLNLNLLQSSQCGYIDVAGGAYHSLFVRDNGTVWASGLNDWGQLGISQSSAFFPKQVTGLKNVNVVAAGYDHSLAVKIDGTVWAWGDNRYGQLGDGTVVERRTPTQVIGLTNVNTVTAGQEHSLALKSNGTVWAWGDNQYGQLGDGTVMERRTPTQVIGLTNVVSISAQGMYSLALKTDGTVWHWGLGGMMSQQINTPTKINNLSGIKEISTMGTHSLALKSAGTVWAWGTNIYGDILCDNGCNGSGYTAARITGLANITAITTGWNSSLAIKADGTAWAISQDGIHPINSSPATEHGNQGFTNNIDAGFYHFLSIKKSGRVWAWGGNDNGQLGDGSNVSKHQVKVLDLFPCSGTADIDSDNDGILDSWEYLFFDSLSTADQISDNDGDGITDLQEITNIQMNKLDPNSKSYDPNIINASGGTISQSGSNIFWTLMTPVLINSHH